MPNNIIYIITKRVQKLTRRIENFATQLLLSRKSRHTFTTNSATRNTNSTDSSSRTPNRTNRHASNNSRQRLNLPFVKRKQDIGELIYRHRTAICITIICYLILSIFFVSSKIILDRHKTDSSIIVDFNDLENIHKELEKSKELNRLLNEQKQYDSYEDVSNRISNDNGESDDNILNRNGSMNEIYDNAAKIQGRVRANRERFEKGLNEEQAMIDAHKNKGETKQNSTTAKVKGKVTVSYSLTNPIRNAEDLYIPAYRCEGGGEVVVKITVNRNGDVIDATVDATVSSSDYCMTSTAVMAAKRSRFDVNLSAPAKQYGTIEYLFIPQ